MRSSRFVLAPVAAFVIGIASSNSAFAASISWNVAGPADWNTPANWNPAGPPSGTNTAVFNNGGTANITANVPSFGDAWFGSSGSSGGTVNQSAGSLVSVGWLRMNMDGAANSTYAMSGFGTSASFTRVNVNEAAGSASSTLNVQGGTMTIPTSSAGQGAGALFIGGGTGSGTGIVNVSGGTLSVGADTAGDQSIIVGTGGTNAAQLNVSGSGTVNVVNSGDMIIGKNSPGVLTQTGGNVNLFTGAGASSWLFVGGYATAGTNSTGTYTMSGGTLSDPNRMEIADLAGSTGTFNFSGGLATSANVGTIEFGSGNGTVNLGGTTGTLTVGQIQSASGGTGTFNFNGGILKPSASNASFMQGLAAANIQSVGATINTNGFNITIAQNLAHDPGLGGNKDGGLTLYGAGGSVTLSGNNTFTGFIALPGNNAPVGVLINGGNLRLGSAGALNASGVNAVAFDRNLGSNFFDPSAALSLNGNNATIAGLDSPGGGTVQNGSATPATLTLNTTTASYGTSSVIQDGAGGGPLSLVKSGGFTETLAGNNTFTGGVTINEGNLFLGSTTALGAATNSVTFGSGGSSGFGSLFLLGNSIAIGDLNSTVAVPNMQIANGFTGGPATLTVTAAGTDTFADVIANGTGTGALSLAKAGAGSLTLTATNTFTGGVALNAGTLMVGNNAALGTGTLTGGGGALAADGNGPYNVANPVSLVSSLTVAGSNNFTLSGQISGSGSLVKTGSSTVTFGGNNSFTGGVTINAGVLRLGNPGALNSTTPNSVSFGANSTGTLSLNGNNITVSGLNTSLPVGTPVVQNFFATPATLTVSIAAGPASPYFGVLADGPGGGALALLTNGAGTLVLGGNDTFTGGVTINAGTLQLGSAGALNSTTPNAVKFFGTSGTLTLAGNSVSVGGLSGIASGTIVQNASATPAALTTIDTGGDTFAGSLQDGAGGGPLSLVKAGAGVLALSGNNTFTGGVTINAGTLIPLSAGALNSTSPNTVTFGPGSTGNLSLGVSSLTISGLSTNANVGTPYVDNHTAAPATLVVNNAGNYVYAGILENTGEPAITLVKSGTGTLTLSGNNAFTGGVTINSGTLDLASAGALNATAPNKVTFGPGSTGTLELATTSVVTIGGLDSNANVGTPKVQALASLSGGASLKINNTGTDSFAGNLIYSGPYYFALDKVGTGTQILSGNNSFTSLSIGAGNVQLGSAGALPNLVGVAFDPGSTGVLTLAGFSVTVSGLANAPNVGTPVIQNASPNPATFTLDDFGFDNEFDGSIRDGSGGGALALTKTGNGTLVLGGNNAFTGGVTINGGIVELGSAGALNSSTPNVVTFGANGVALGLDGNSVTIAGLVASTTDPVVVNFSPIPATLTVQVAAASSFAGALQDGTGLGKLSLTKTGPGTLTLSGANTFTGPVNINGGTLVESGGALAADVHDQATFVYNGGAFSGRLFLDGIVTFNTDFTAGNGMENDVNFSIPSSRTITLNGLGLDNEGTLTMAGGTLNLSTSVSAANLNRGTFNLSATVPISFGGATLTNAGTLNLDGGLLSGPGTLINNPGGIVTGNGTIQCAFANNGGGTVIVGAGTTNITSAFTNNGLIQLTAANSDLVGAAITNSASGTIQGLGVVGNAVTNLGTIESIGGTLSIDGALGNPVGGFLTVDAGSKLFVGAGLAANAGIINLTGGTFDNGGRALNNTGQISGWGIFRTGGTGLDNHGSITFSGGITTVNGPVTNENGRTITVAQNPAVFTGMVTNNGGATFNTVNATATFAGGFTNNGSSNFAAVGNGAIDVPVAPAFGNASSLAIGGASAMRFSAVSGAATVGAGVTATVSSSATLELAGSVSALSSGANRVNVTNNSTATAGILVSGTNQVVGNIDGSGTTQVNAGSDLTANHIIQSVLVIGGTASNHSLVTIDASDASGNPLIAGAVFDGGSRGEAPAAMPAANELASVGDASVFGTSGGDFAEGPALSRPSGVEGAASTVPEPSAAFLFLMGTFALLFSIAGPAATRTQGP